MFNLLLKIIYLRNNKPRTINKFPRFAWKGNNPGNDVHQIMNKLTDKMTRTPENTPHQFWWVQNPYAAIRKPNETAIHKKANNWLKIFPKPSWSFKIHESFWNPCKLNDSEIKVIPIRCPIPWTAKIIAKIILIFV